MEYSKDELERHIKQEHQMSPFATYLREIVYGGSDGIITTFAVVGGFAGAQGGSHLGGIGYMAVLLFGLANLFADGFSMALGNILSIRSEQDRYRKERAKEEREMNRNLPMEKAETVQLLIQRGFEKEDAHSLVELYSKNKEYWADFMMRYELGMEDLREVNPFATGFATLVAFIAFGSIPLVPYIFFSGTSLTFPLAVAFTFSALILLGILRWRVTSDSLIRSVGEIVFLGGISSCVAFFVGTFFKG